MPSPAAPSRANHAGRFRLRFALQASLYTHYNAQTTREQHKGRGQIGNALQRLQHNPEQQGKTLTGELSGYRSICVANQRFRIIYRVDREAVEVLVVQVGLRKESDRDDVYQLAKRWLRRGLLEP